MMPQEPRDSRRHVLLAGLVILAAVLFRSWFLLEFDESYFDSDQAIVGLMAKHLVEGRARPLFFYGQEYMLGVESWVMAPFFAAFGPTVLALRLTLVVLNAITALLLWRLLVTDARLNVWLAALAASPFIIAPFVTSAHLLEAQGGNIEPFLWVLIAWTLRERPLALGAVLAIGFLNREFTAYAVPALLLTQLVAARGRVGPLVRPWLLTAVAFLVVFQGVNALKPYADLMGPGSAGVPVTMGSQDTVTLLLARVKADPAALPARFSALTTVYLPMVVGLDGFRPNMLSIGTDLHVGWRELLPFTAGASALLLVWLLADGARRRSVEASAFPIYLAIIGVESGIVYALTRDPNMVTFRYILLSLFLPVGFAAMLLQPWRPTAMRAAGGAVCGLLAAASIVDHAAVLDHARTAPPPPRFMPLAERLEAGGVRLARGGYWRSYAVTFLTSERVIVASTELQRVLEYQQAVERAGSGVVTIQETPCDGQRPLDTVGPWHLCQ